MLVANSNVLVELGAMEKSPDRSPSKIYTPLMVAAPNTVAVPTSATDDGQVHVVTIDRSTVDSDIIVTDSASSVVDIITETPLNARESCYTNRCRDHCDEYGYFSKRGF